MDNYCNTGNFMAAGFFRLQRHSKHSPVEGLDSHTNCGRIDSDNLEFTGGYLTLVFHRLISRGIVLENAP